MFSSYSHLKRKTPDQGINRQEYIEHLVEEYYTTTNVEAQEQVTANLANFAYDPLNWNYLKTSQSVKLFIELLETPNEKLQTHGSAGLCNICLDSQACIFITKKENIKTIKNLLHKTENLYIVLNVLTLFYQLLLQSETSKSNILCTSTLKEIKSINVTYQKDQRIINICSLLLDTFGKRYEIVEIKNNMPLNHKKIE